MFLPPLISTLLARFVHYRYILCKQNWKVEERNKIEKSYKINFEGISSLFTSTFDGIFIVHDALPINESSKAFRLLVGTIRCGKRGEPLTRSRSVGWEFWWIMELRLRLGKMKFTLGSGSCSSVSSISTSGTFSMFALIVKAIDFRRFRLFISSGSTISIEELMALPLWANDAFRSDSGSSGFMLSTWQDELVFELYSPVNKFMWDFRAFAIWDGANDAVDVFRLGARDPNRPFIRFKNPLLSLFCWCVNRRFNKSIAGTREPFSSTICGWELKHTDRRIGIVMCSVLGHEARGMTGGRTDKSKRGRVPEILGLADFGLSPILPSMTISGCKHAPLNIRKWNFQGEITLICGIMETWEDDVDDERFSSIRSNLAISASRFAISFR